MTTTCAGNDIQLTHVGHHHHRHTPRKHVRVRLVFSCHHKHNHNSADSESRSHLYMRSKVHTHRQTESDVFIFSFSEVHARKLGFGGTAPTPSCPQPLCTSTCVIQIESFAIVDVVVVDVFSSSLSNRRHHPQRDDLRVVILLTNCVRVMAVDKQHAARPLGDFNAPNSGLSTHSQIYIEYMYIYINTGMTTLIPIDVERINVDPTAAHVAIHRVSI